MRLTPILFSLLLLAIAVCQFTSADIVIQDFFYNVSEQRWLINKHDAVLAGIFHDGLRYVIYALGAIFILMLIASYQTLRLREYRYGLWVVVLSLSIVPVSISSLKLVTNTYCPAQIERYGGTYPYVRVYESYPEHFVQDKRGRCWPAGHASGGFTLIALYYLFISRRAKIAGACAGLGVGSIMGGFQMLRGEHFMSHTLITLLMAWLMVWGIARLVRYVILPPANSRHT